MSELTELGKKARQAQKFLSCASTEQKNNGLEAIAQALTAHQDQILEANAKDLKGGREAGLSEALLDRLALNQNRIQSMAQGCRDMIALPDPIGRTLNGFRNPNGLEIRKVTVPLGVIGIIYEARPNVTADAAALCLKSGNVVLLRGGKEAIHSNTAIMNVMRSALEQAGIPADCVALVKDTSRESANELMRLNEYLDVLIPRGGAGLIQAVVKNATVPVVETGSGNCHVYVDADADPAMAAEIVWNAKTSRPSVCNACESLVVHRRIAEEALPRIAARLREKQVEIRGDERTCAILPDAVPAAPEDFRREYLDYIISVKIVDSLQEAIDHINTCSTGHSECIVTENLSAALAFQQQVDSAAVYVNASTRFTDGGEFGFGAEIGISTQKLHARGPMGLEQLTSSKYLITGNGQIR